MEWKQQFEIFNKIISQRLSEEGLKPTLKNAAEYLEIPVHKYQAWKDGQRPVTEDLRKLAQEFEFNAEWLLLGIGEPVQPRMDHPFDPKYVEICDTLEELVRSLPDRLPKIAEVGGITTTDLYNCIQTQAFPPSEAVANWIRHYRINGNFLLAQIGRPFLTDEEYNESGKLNYVRQRRGDFMELDEREDTFDDEQPIKNSKVLNKEISALQKENTELNHELRESAKEIRHLNEEKRQLEARISELITLADAEDREATPAISASPATGAQEDGTSIPCNERR